MKIKLLSSIFFLILTSVVVAAQLRSYGPNTIPNLKVPSAAITGTSALMATATPSAPGYEIGDTFYQTDTNLNYIYTGGSTIQWNQNVTNYIPTTVRPSGSITLSYPDPNNVNYFLDGAGNTITASLGGTGLLGLGIFNLSHNTSGDYNTAVGIEAIDNNTTGSWNTGFGYQPLFFNTTGSSNTAVGYSALLANTIGSNNTAIGFNSLLNSVNGASNVALGYYSSVNSVSGSDNTAIGFAANENVTNGNNNTALGFQALASGVTESGSIGIGKDAGYYSTNSNEFYLGNQDWGSNANEKNNDLLSGVMAPTPTSDTIHTPGSLTVGNIGAATAVTVYGNFVQCNASPTPTCVVIIAP